MFCHGNCRQEKQQQDSPNLTSRPVQNNPAVNKKWLKIEQAQTILKWSILSWDVQKYLS